MLEFKKLRKLMILKLYLARNSGPKPSFEFYLVKKYLSGKVKYGTCENIWPKIFTYFNIKIGLRIIFYISQKMLCDY